MEVCGWINLNHVKVTIRWPGECRTHEHFRDRFKTLSPTTFCLLKLLVITYVRSVSSICPALAFVLDERKHFWLLSDYKPVDLLSALSKNSCKLLRWLFSSVLNAAVNCLPFIKLFLRNTRRINLMNSRATNTREVHISKNSSYLRLSDFSSELDIGVYPLHL